MTQLDQRLARAKTWRGVRTVTRAEVRTPILQAVKATIAVSVAWALADTWLGLQQPFLAPWAALLTVHATVFRSVKGGGQIILASFLGILLSFAAVEVLGYGLVALALTVLIGLLISNVRGMRTEGVTVATTALFVLTAGTAQDQVVLVHRLSDTLIGVGVGVVVNLLIVPPLDHGLAERQRDLVTSRLGRLLVRMADEMSLPAREEHADAWVAETREIDRDLDRAEELLRFTSESHRWNPRRRTSGRVADVDAGQAELERLEDAVARARSIARTVGEAVATAASWDPRFRDPWLELLAEAGARATDWDPSLDQLSDRVQQLVDDLSGVELSGRYWPTYGALLQSLDVIILVVDEVIGDGEVVPEALRSSRSTRRPGDNNDGGDGEG